MTDASAPDHPQGPGEAARVLEGEARPLHPAAIWLWTLETALPLLLLVVVAGLHPFLALAFLAALLALNWVRYRLFRWRVEPDSLVIERGLLHRRRRVIRRDQIQTVDLERGVRHRLLGVVEVRVEAIGAGGTEGKLAALDGLTAEALRRILLSGPAPTPFVGEAEAPAPGEILARVSPGRLVLAGLTGSRVGVAAALVGFLLQFVPEEVLVQLLEPRVPDVPDPSPAVAVALVLGIVGLALLAGFVLSVAATVVVHWDFTLSRADGTLWVQRGLLTQHRDSVPLHRIQAVRVEENVVRRVLGFGAVRAIVAGRAGPSEDRGADLLLPVGGRKEAFDLAEKVIGLGDAPAAPLQPMPPGARDRRLVRAAAAAVVAALVALAGAAAVAGPGWLAPAGFTVVGGILVGGPAAALALSGYRALGWTDLGTHLVVREGVFNRRSSFVPVDRLQELVTRTSPFQRRRGLATLHLRTARPVARGFTPRAVDLGEEKAEELRDGLPRRIRRTEPGSPRARVRRM